MAQRRISESRLAAASATAVGKSVNGGGSYLGNGWRSSPARRHQRHGVSA
jgi:hypothetical protein